MSEQIEPTRQDNAVIQEATRAHAIVEMGRGTDIVNQVPGNVARHENAAVGSIKRRQSIEAWGHINLPQGHYEATVDDLGNASVSVERRGMPMRHFGERYSQRAGEIVARKAVDIIAPAAVDRAERKIDMLKDQIDKVSK